MVVAGRQPLSRMKGVLPGLSRNNLMMVQCPQWVESGLKTAASLSVGLSSA
jgi:hypothetical protein